MEAVHSGGGSRSDQRFGAHAVDDGAAVSATALIRSGTLDFLADGGELGALIRGYDWTTTPLGAPAGWPQNLRTALRIMLTSSQPIWIGWGQDLIYFYNDAYKSIIGGKHPWALGKPTAEVWREVWSDIGPMLDTAMGGDQGTYVEAQLLIMERNGYPEETYYTFSYSPIPNDDGSVGGIICVNTDDTQRVIGHRQLALLRELAASPSEARTSRDACHRSGRALATNARDLPFAMIYLAERNDPVLKLISASGIEPGHPAAPATISLEERPFWPAGEALRTHDLAIKPDLAATMDAKLPRGPWSQPPRQAALLPILPAGDTGRGGVLIVGLNPFRLLDEDYRSFLWLVARQIAAAIANAEAYEEERRRAEALAELDRAKTAFFSNVSHEFRTPLTLMISPIEDALNDAAGLTLPQRERLEVAHRNSLRLLKLVNSLLDFSRIEARRIEARFERIDLAKFTAELASNFESATEKAALALRIDCPTLPQPTYVDRDMWETIVLNLLSNAFKFTFEGEIAVEVGPSADGTAAEMTVRDTGVGIPERELPRLFERFHRVEGQRSRSFEGSGIGLALVQELVKLHGGTIRVESRVGQGSTFTVSIPFGTAQLAPDRIVCGQASASTSLRADAYVEEALRWLPDPDRATEAAEGSTDRIDDGNELPADSRQDVRILVADDNADMRGYIHRLLGTRWQVEAVSDGEAALAALRARKPDLLLTDVMMPGLDGFGLLKVLRSDPALRDMPVILLSARAGEEARVEGLNAGADDYLTKPFAARELIARVNANLEMARVRREATRDLRESEARFRNMADHAPVMMWVTDAAGSLTYLNRYWCEFTGQTLEAAVGQGAWDVLHPDDRDAAKLNFVEASTARRAFRTEYRLRRADGVYRWTLSAAAPRFAEGDEFLGYIGSLIDITDLKEAERVLQQANETLEHRVATAIAERTDAEAQLRQAQKMDAIGKLTGGVAHDFNNVLQVVAGNLQLLTKDVAGNLRAEQRLQTSLAATSRGSKLASQLLAFGRRQPLAPKVVNLGRLIRGIDDMLRRALGEGVEIETMIAGGLWNTSIDAAQVENALLNLAINARDAMKGHGRLTIEAGNAFLDDTYVARYPDITAGQYVMVAVTDTGCGIPPELIERVVEPFFTTKPEGAGTGLGLSMVYGFVKQSGGHIKIYSEIGHGTTVRLYLPRSREQEDVETEIDTGPTTGGSETILVVEDDEDVRSTVVDTLSDLGYRVLKAADARNALAVIESGLAIDVLFTDVVMPGPIRSPDLARKARERLPGIAVLFTSGYSENAIAHGGRLDEGIDLLSKPYGRETLARKLRQVLKMRQQQNLAPGSAAAGPRQHDSARDGAMPAQLLILLVEDEPMIRLCAAEMLATLGHTVVEAQDAAEARPLFEQYPIDVLVTDLSLPGVSGSDLAAELLARRPDLRIVFTTGYDLLPSSTTQEVLARAVVLRKPYNQQRLATALQGALAKPS